MLAGKPLPFFGDGSAARDYTWVEDIVAGVVASLEVPLKYDTFNLGGNRVTTLVDQTMIRPYKGRVVRR